MGHLSKKTKIYPLKMHEKAPGGQKSNFSNDILERENSETAPAKVRDFGENNSLNQKNKR